MANQDQEKEREYTPESHVLEDSSAAEKYEYSDGIGTKERIAGKIKSVVLGKPEKNVVTLPEAVRVSNNIRTILLGLFTLIGFIVLVFAIFTASVNADLAQTAAGVFLAALIAAIVGAFALLGIVLYPIRVENKMQ
jgi:uncharacterized membrane protein